MLLGIGDIDTSSNLTEHLITVTDINDNHIRQLLEELAHDGVHEEALTATTRAKDKVVTVIGHLLSTFFACEIHTDGNALTVCVPELQGSLLTLLLTLLIHHAEGCITECQETVIIRIELAAVAGEAGNKEFELVVGTLGNLDIHLTEEVLQIVRDPGHAGILGNGNDKVEVGIDQLFVLTGNDVLNILDILYGKLIAGRGNRAMTVLFLVEHSQFLLLVGHENDLIIDG